MLSLRHASILPDGEPFGIGKVPMRLGALGERWARDPSVRFTMSVLALAACSTDAGARAGSEASRDNANPNNFKEDPIMVVSQFESQQWVDSRHREL